MKLIILNGSPKGNESVTMQYILYIKNKIPEHEYQILNVAQQANILEKNENRFQDVIKEIENADGIVWGFPVYVMLICSQYKRFIELIFENGVEESFKDKYSVVLSTSIHFYDHTAQNYIHGICDDLNMKYVDFFAADSWDLLYPKRRANWLHFMENFFECIKRKIPTQKYYSPINARDFVYIPEKKEDYRDSIDLGGKNILVVSESIGSDNNLGKMVNQFKSYFSEEIKTVNINELEIISGCIGCIKCGYDHTCHFADKDSFKDFWEGKIMKADILIFAGQLKDRFLSSRWKMVYDRAFYNNHTPTMIGKQIGYIISGPLSQNQNLKEILQAHVEYQDSNLVGFITDEFGTSEYIDDLLYNFALNLVTCSKQGLIKPKTFLGEGAMKIFRDDVYGRNRFVFLADHEYYQSHGVYDTFPQRDERAKKMNEKLIPLLKIDKVRNKLDLKQEFLKPFKRVIEDPNK